VSLTPNKNLQMPASGSFNNAWAAPVNLNFSEIDTAFGGSVTINITGFPENTQLTLAQYQPPNIIVTGNSSTQVALLFPTNVGGLWSIVNSTTGAFSLFLFNNQGVGGRGLLLLQGQRYFVVSDGINVDLADPAPSTASQTAAEAFATAADTVVTTNANTFATNAANTAQANANAFSANASNLSSGTVPNAQLPNAGVMPGIIIQADPGGTPSGPPGTLWLYY
jgi:hypothetical protein